MHEELAAADAVLPSLGAGEPDLYKTINRPHPHATFDRLLQGLIEFRREYRGQLWVEVMLVRGLNDTPQALSAVARALEQIQPDAVHLNLQTRAPVETWVEPPDEEGLMRAVAALGAMAQVVHPAQGAFDMSGCHDAAEAVVAIITRHPRREEELVRTLDRWAPGRIKEALSTLLGDGHTQVVERYGYGSGASQWRAILMRGNRGGRRPAISASPTGWRGSPCPPS